MIKKKPSQGGSVWADSEMWAQHGRPRKASPGGDEGGACSNICVPPTARNWFQTYNQHLQERQSSSSNKKTVTAPPRAGEGGIRHPQAGGLAARGRGPWPRLAPHGRGWPGSVASTQLGGLTSPCGLVTSERLQDSCTCGYPLTSDKPEWRVVVGMGVAPPSHTGSRRCRLRRRPGCDGPGGLARVKSSGKGTSGPVLSDVTGLGIGDWPCHLTPSAGSHWFIRIRLHFLEF